MSHLACMEALTILFVAFCQWALTLTVLITYRLKPQVRGTKVVTVEWLIATLIFIQRIRLKKLDG